MSTRTEWVKRVRRWQESDLTAAEFAAEMGLNANTLSHWKWKLAKEARERQAQASRSSEPDVEEATFVEVTPPASTWWAASERIELVVEDVVVRVPDVFDTDTLRQVLEALRPVEDEE